MACPSSSRPSRTRRSARRDRRGVAAATTSLPEKPGGVRNWDYRYCWIRDATFTLLALLASGYREEAHAWRDWLLRAIAGDPSQLQIMYAIDGARRLPPAVWVIGLAILVAILLYFFTLRGGH